VRLYLHWPFCRSRCHYCDFVTRVAGAGVQRSYLRALLREMEMRACQSSKRGLRSVYLGGGTPSTLSGEEVGELLRRACGLFGRVGEPEVSVEVNPGTWECRDFLLAGKAGVNRVSIGIQSMDDTCLRLLGRSHDAGRGERAVRDAVRAGIPSVSVDLLCGLPVEFGHRPRLDLERVLELEPHHVSIYTLTLSARNRMGRAVAAGELHLPDEDRVAECYLQLSEMLRVAGYQHYEISNFCKPGHACRHNQAYWRREEYLGLGAGAHSFLSGRRYRNTESLLIYRRRLEDGRWPAVEMEPVEGESEYFERVMLGMRTARGIPRRLLRGKEDRLRELQAHGLIADEGGRVRLTEPGMLLCNAVIVELLGA